MSTSFMATDEMTTTSPVFDGSGPAPVDALPASRGVRIEVDGMGVTRRGHVILRDVNLTIEPGELVAIIGSSGAGKSTLLDAIAGIRPANHGAVRLDAVGEDDVLGRPPVGYIPQDDLIHRDLPVAATLRYAARLRLPAGTSRGEIGRIVAETIDELQLADRASARVGDLSGGQRKRVSIGVELLTRPRVFFLDEPTSGLDPATAANLIATLRRLADEGTTVVLTTHNTDDLRACDRIVLVGGGGIEFDGSPAQIRDHFDVEHLADIYVRAPHKVSGSHPNASSSSVTRQAPAEAVERHDRVGTLTQWRVLAARNVNLLRRNRLTLSIMLAAPALVIGMFAMLFQSGALGPAEPDATAAVSTTYWMAFAAFFFGLTFGLLQVCTEMPIVRREVFVGVRISSYLLAKLTVLAPVLAAVNVAMLAVLRKLDRLPPLDADTYGRIAVTLVITSLAALTLGLLVSAAVADPAQATLALPMLCFPAVLFAGAILPVPMMNAGGRAVSTLVIARWAFEALGHDLDLTSLLGNDGSGSGPALLTQHGDAFGHSTTGHWSLLIVFTCAFFAAAGAVIRRRARAN
jgi:ABC-type multidrug transport system ATPase subunit